MSVTVPRMSTNYAAVNTPISATYFNYSKILNAAYINIVNTSMSAIWGNFITRIQSSDTFVYFRINGWTVASFTGRNTIVHYDDNPYGFDLKKNDLYNVDSLYCDSAVINNTITENNASFANACFTNMSITNIYCDSCCHC